MQKLLSLFPQLTEISAQLNFKNLARNPNLDIWQRGTSFVGVANNTYLADGFQLVKAGTAVGDVTQQADVPTASQAFSSFSLRHRVATPQATIGATDSYILIQKIEGYALRSLWKQPLTLSFWVKSTRTGTFCVVFRNGGFDRSFVAEYAINAASVWEKKVIVVPPFPSDGTWNFTNGIGLSVTWVLAAGSSLRSAPSNSWQSANVLATPNQINAVDATNNDFSLSQIQIEPGAVATDFEIRPYALDVLLAKRYYTTLVLSAGGWTSASPNGIGLSSFFFPVQMRVAPTATLGTAGSRTGLDANSIGVTVRNNEGGNISVVPNQSTAGAFHFWVVNDFWNFAADL